jgi:ribonuclease HI
VAEVYIDGGCRGNPGEGAFGFVIKDGTKELQRYGERLGCCTNNVAEYRAFIGALKFLLKNGYGEGKGVTVYSDSELLVKQMRGEYKVHSVKLKPLYADAVTLMRKMSDIELIHISRKQNRLADWIVNRVLDGKEYQTDL